MNIHPEFQAALSKGHVVPVTLPNGEPFIVGGIQYYQASDDGISMYQGRMMSFTDVIEKHNRLKLDETTLRAFFLSVSESATQAMLQIGSDPESAMKYLSDIIALSSYGKQRLDLYEDLAELNVGSNTARVYELSSIWFFASDEDPAVYDPTKGKRFISLTMKRPELYDFFLRLRLNQFAPLAAHSAESTRKCITAMQESEFQGLLLFTTTLLRFKTSGTNPTTIRYLESLTATLRGYDTCYTQLLNNLTTIWPPISDDSSMKLSSNA